MIERKSHRELEIMRAAGQKLAAILQKVAQIVEPGVSTGQLDRIARQQCERENVRAAFLGYKGPAGAPDFPGVVCASLNDEVVHGLPSDARVLKEGDLLKLDFGVVYKGYFSDAAVTLPVGQVSSSAKQLMLRGREALYAGIAQCSIGKTVGDIGAAVESVAIGYNLGIVRDFVGHGIGRALHEDPQVPNYGKAGTGAVLKQGTVLAIEPMLNIGGDEVEVKKDGWTVVTKDGSLSVHVEHTVAITANGPEILTEGTPLFAEGA